MPEPSTIARSLPTTVPESPNYRNARTPRTPRTPQLKDPTQTPRFYPVVKEGRLIDAKVRPAHQLLLCAYRYWVSLDSARILCESLMFIENLLYVPSVSYRHPGKGKHGTVQIPQWNVTLVG